MKRFYAAVERADETGNAITRAGCWAHMKRKIIDAEKSAPEIAREAVERVRALYAIERQGKDGSINRPSGAQNGHVQEQ
jgi:uncharacterized Fe-S cluster-containing radical SAM superfamily protein